MGGQNIIITSVHYYKVCVKKKWFVSLILMKTSESTATQMKHFLTYKYCFFQFTTTGKESFLLIKC